MFGVISNTVNEITRFQFSDTYAMDGSEHGEAEKNCSLVSIVFQS